jgi:hypothetical protein
MTIRPAPLLLIAALVGAAAFAVFRGTSSPDVPAPGAAANDVAKAEPAANPHAGQLPPDHPPIGASAPADSVHGAAGAAGASEGDDHEPITWKAPEGFASAPNPNPMRIATFKASPAKGDAEGAELAISRAGGSMDANVARWLGQFDEHEKELVKEKTINGLKVTTVEINGTFRAGAMMGGDPAAPKKDWSFVAAVVDAAGESYFFKLTGPRATVKSVRKSFDAMIDGVKPAPAPAAK